MRFLNDAVLRARPSESLTLEEMRASLPAIFAPQPHESRSDRYVYVSTEEVLGALMAEGFLPVEARVARSRDQGRAGFAKHMVRLRKDAADLKVGDTYFETILKNAHDGSACYDASAGLWRLLCLNGMAVGEGTVSSVHIRHSGNRDRQIGAVVEGAYQLIEQAPMVMDAPRLWPSIELTRDEQMVYADAARTLRFGDAQGEVDTPITAEQLLLPRRPQDSGRDLWTTFNVVQENAIKGGLRAAFRDDRQRWRRMSTREVKGIDADIKLNRALWTVASEMAKLKA
jgi:hypothetical protein